LVFILRWFWWRVNAWSEIAAMLSAGFISLTLQSSAGMPVVRMLHGMDAMLPLAPLNTDDPHAFAWLMLITTGLTTLIWMTVTLMTAPEPDAKLQSFYNLVRPPALGWKRFAPASALAENTLRWNTLHWALGFSMIYSALFGIGNLLFGRVADGLLLLVLSSACLAMLFRSLNRQNWSMFR
jgi:SSS family solute:Na+ symporter